MSPGRMWARLQNLVAFGTTTAAMNDGGNAPTVQAKLTELETQPALQMVHHFGFSSSPPIGSRILALFGAGDRSKGVVVGTVDGGTRYRNLAPGESVQFNGFGMSLRMSQAGIVVNCGGMPVTFTNAPKARFEMPVESTGEVKAMCDGAFVTLSQHQGHSGGGQKPTPNT